MGAGAIVAFKTDDFRAGEVMLEPQDIVDIGAAPAVDRLVIIANAAKIAARLREKAQPEILNDIGVLIFVDENIAKPLLVMLQNFLALAKQPQAFEQKVAEIDSVENFQALLIERIEFGALAVGEGRRFAWRNMRRVETAVLPPVDLARQRARRPTFVVNILGLQNLLEKSDLVVGVENRKIGFQPD